jgi:1,4-dihydroxy-2-naphthoate octaprenyltransferase
MLPSTQEIDRPSTRLTGSGIGPAIRRCLLATRPAFLTASVLPVFVGTAWAAAHAHLFNGFFFGLALVATILAHAATNVYNDVSDDEIGTDPGNTGRIYPYTGGSRFIQTGLLSRHQMRGLAIGLCAAALTVGGALAVVRGPGVVVLGLCGLALGLLYSLPGVQLSARGIGEFAVALGLGVLPVLGSAWLQTGTVDTGAALLCIPVSCWIAAILIINEVPDIAADRRAGKRTLVVRWGASGARRIYASLTLTALASSIVALTRHVLPAWYLVIALGLCGAGWVALRGISSDPGARTQVKQSIERTLAIQAAGCIFLIVALFVGRV